MRILVRPSAADAPTTRGRPGAAPGVGSGVPSRTRAELGRQLDACRVVCTSPGLRAAQVPLAAAKTVDLAQLVALSTYLFDIGGVRLVATYGIVRAIAPAVRPICPA